MEKDNQNPANEEAAREELASLLERASFLTQTLAENGPKWGEERDGWSYLCSTPGHCEYSQDPPPRIPLKERLSRFLGLHQD